jgi:hypothetical protein
MPPPITAPNPNGATRPTTRTPCSALLCDEVCAQPS